MAVVRQTCGVIIITIIMLHQAIASTPSTPRHTGNFWCESKLGCTSNTVLCAHGHAI
jgi:hypothetical protein